MKRIYLKNKDVFTLVDDDTYEVFGSLTWHAFKAPNSYSYYVKHTMWLGGRHVQFRLHREVLEAPPGMQVDHINGDGLDNRRENLRLCTPSQNQANRPAYRTNKSGFKGVHWHKASGGWVAQIRKDGKSRHLGVFSSPEEAHKVYCRAAEELFGCFARTNSEGWSL